VLTLGNSPSFHKVTKIINFLSKRSDSISLVTSRKGTRFPDSKTDPPTSDEAGLASSMISLNTTYRFRLGGHAFLSSTAGVIDTFFAADPSAAGTNFPEWSTLSALFSEFKLVEFGVQFSRGAISVSSASFAPAMICGNLGTAVAPGSYAAVADNADSKLYAFLHDTSVLGYTHIIRDHNQLNYSQVTTPTIEPYAGAPGSIQIYCGGGSGAQAGVIHCLVWGIYDFRSRV
jgi:hypothetical protein